MMAVSTLGHPAPAMPRTPDKANRAGAIDLSTLDHLMGYRLALAYLPSRAAFVKAIGTPLQLRRVEFTLLMLLLANGSLTQKQLTRALAISAPALTLLLDRMEGNGWLERRRSELDRRLQEVSLSPQGLQLARDAHARSLDCEHELLADFTPGETRLLRELLDKLARHRHAG